MGILLRICYSVSDVASLIRNQRNIELLFSTSRFDCQSQSEFKDLKSTRWIVKENRVCKSKERRVEIFKIDFIKKKWFAAFKKKFRRPSKTSQESFASF